jgi:GT2 family glycosyltransferase
VLKACKNIDAEIFVVDNNSTDGSRQWLEPCFPMVKFKWNSTNEGFGKASNSVLREAKGSHILFLNPDTIVPEDCFEKCISFFKEHPNCGALGVKMIDGSGKFLKESKRSLPSVKFSMFKMTGLAKLFPSSGLFAGYYAGHLPATANNKVQVLAGAFIMLGKNAIDATGGFDEAFFMYGEDVDLSYRVNRAGFDNWYFADTSILHFKGESTQKLSAAYIQNFYGAMILFVKKHYSGQKAKIFFLQSAIGMMKLLAGMKSKIKGSSTPAPASTPLNTAIVAGQRRFDETLQLIKYANFPLVICGRISVDKNDKDFSIGKVNNLADVIKKNAIRQVVFCEGEQSFKTIIEEMQKVPSRVTVLLNAANSNSMVGSNDKNEKGFFIARPSVL